MRNLIKLFIVVIAFTMTSQTFAQTFGVKAGLNLSNLLVKGNGSYSYQSKLKPGFAIGATAELLITKLFSFETGLLFSTKGEKSDQKDISVEVSKLKSYTNLYYVEMPLTGKVSFNVGGTKI